MTVYYLTENSRFRQTKPIRFDAMGKGEFTVYNSVASAKKDIYKDKLENDRYPHDDFTYEETVDPYGIITITEFDNRHSDWYSDPGIEKTVYQIIPVDLTFEKNTDY